MEESDGGADSVRKGVAVVKVRLAYNPQNTFGTPTFLPKNCSVNSIL